MPWLAATGRPAKKGAVAAAKKSRSRPELLSGKYKNRASIQDLVYRLAQHDVVSFDVFGTVLVRPFLDARDVFSVLELELDQPDFRFDRIEAEKEARNVGMRAMTDAPREVSLREIYERLHRRSGVDVEVGMQAELGIEARYNRSNEYIVEALYSLLAAGKQVVLTADTHFSSEEVRQLLKSTGVDIDVPIFVSSEHGVSKRKGDLYDVVRIACSKEVDGDRSFINVGTDRIADVVRAQERGWNARLYTGIHDLQGQLSPSVGNSIQSSAALGLINIRFGNITRPSGGKLDHYALGYRYGGPMALGYVDWLTKRARELELDQLVFLSPDGYLPHTIARLLDSEIPVQYLSWSTRFGLHSAVRDFKSDWIDEFITRSSEQGFETAEQLLASLNVSIEPAILASYLDRLDEKSADALTRMFQEQWDLILPQLVASSEPFREAIVRTVTGSRVGIVASGLSGRDLLYLRSVLNDRNVNGFQFGSLPHQRSAAILENGAIENFVFGGEQNIRVRKTVMKSGEHSGAVISALFGAPQVDAGSVVKDGDAVNNLPHADELVENAAIRHTLAGALDFVVDFQTTFAEGPQLRGLSGAVIGELYTDLVGNPNLLSTLRREFPIRFTRSDGPKARDA